MKRYEQEQQLSNKSTYWLIFELMFRDFYHYLCQKYQNAIFFPGGMINNKKGINWKQEEEKIVRWKQGLTGVPFIDANMRELLHTGNKLLSYSSLITISNDCICCKRLDE